jgi:hypothetical protein
VPVVLHGFVPPAPSGTGASTTSGCAAFPPLWPGSRTTTGAGAGGGGGVGDGVGTGEGVAVAGAGAAAGARTLEAAEPAEGAAAVVEQPARLTRSAAVPARSHRTGPGWHAPSLRRPTLVPCSLVASPISRSS